MKRGERQIKFGETAEKREWESGLRGFSSRSIPEKEIIPERV